MVVALILLTFAVFAVVELIRRRRAQESWAREGEVLHHILERSDPRWVAGFQLPSFLSYHPSHLWVHQVGPDEAYVGVDDFARRLLGRNAHVTPPAVGTRVAQGDEAIGVQRDGTALSLMSPVTGDVVAVNPKLKEDPGSVYRDAYGRGWIFRVRSSRLRNEVSNLLSGSLAQRWMEDTRDRFQHQLTLATGSVIQDGGMPIEDLAGSLTPEDWRELVTEFLSPVSASSR